MSLRHWSRFGVRVNPGESALRTYTIIENDDEEAEEASVNPGGYHIPIENKPSEKQVNYLKSLAEALPSNEQSDLMTRLPQMTRYDVSQLISNLKTT